MEGTQRDFGRFENEDEWRAWQRDRAKTLQRERRARMRRIDYYPSEEAVRIIDRLRRPYAGGDASSIISRLICEWAERYSPTIPELNARKCDAD